MKKIHRSREMKKIPSERSKKRFRALCLKKMKELAEGYASLLL